MKKRWKVLTLAICMLVWVLFSGSAQNKQYQEAKQGVVAIEVYFEDVLTGRRVVVNDCIGSGGTGFFVGESGKNPEYLITNHHVIEDFYLRLGSGELIPYSERGVARAHIDVCFGSGVKLPANVVDYNELADVAILRLSEATDKRVPLTLMEPTKDMVGDTVYTFGFPGISDNILSDPISTDGLDDMSVTSGIIGRLLTISGKGIKTIQTTADIYHGNSGGPMTDAYGRVIGVNTWGHSSGGEQEKYAVNIAEAILLLRQNGIAFDEVSASDAIGPAMETETANSGAIDSADGTDGKDNHDETDHTLIIIGIAAAAVVAVAVTLALVLRKRKGKGGETSGMVSPAGPVDPPTASNSGGNVDSGYRIQCTSGALSGQRLMIRVSGQLVLGRNGQVCNVVYPDTPGVSGKHCAVWYNNGNLYLQDLGSTHGTFLNGKKLQPNVPVTVRAGDSFALGSQKESFTLVQKR